MAKNKASAGQLNAPQVQPPSLGSAPATPAPATSAAAKPKKAFSLERLKGTPQQAGGWQLVTIFYVTEDGVDRIVKVERTEPNLKRIALDDFRIAAAKYWTQEAE